jgi:5'-deoxynucleotidase YfbR-like HD superfamily hydrolase
MENKEPVNRVVDTIEAGEVIRFHAVPSIASQTVAQHSWGVMLLGAYILKEESTTDFLVACALHDTGEIITGDIPFTAKRGCFKHLAQMLEEAEETAMEQELWPMPELSPKERFVLKLSDMLEGLRWAVLNERAPQIVAGRWFDAIANLFQAADSIEGVEVHHLKRAYSVLRAFCNPDLLQRCVAIRVTLNKQSK